MNEGTSGGQVIGTEQEVSGRRIRIPLNPLFESWQNQPRHKRLRTEQARFRERLALLRQSKNESPPIDERQLRRAIQKIGKGAQCLASEALRSETTVPRQASNPGRVGYFGKDIQIMI